MARTDKKKSRSGVGGMIAIVLIVAVLLIVLDKMGTISLFSSPEERQKKIAEEFVADTGAWHAVFLTNGQVYFGQLSSPEAQFATIKDVYYLQVQQVQAAPVEPTGTGSQVVAAPQPQPPQLTLIKFGTELHGPKDWMKINRDQILFWEELKPESTVVQAIMQYKEGQAVQE